MEQRHFKRVKFVTKAHLETGGTIYATDVLDLSLKGALVKKPHTPLPDTTSPMLLCLQLNGSAEMLVMQVEIAHQDAEHLGLLCTKIDIDSISHLRRLLELNLGDPDLLSRELAELTNHD